MVNLKDLKFVIVISVILIGLFIFLVTPKLLVQKLFILDGIPVGTAVSMAFPVCYSFFMLWVFPANLSKIGIVCRMVALFSVVLSCDWAVISGMWAKNWPFYFTPKSLKWNRYEVL